MTSTGLNTRSESPSHPHIIFALLDDAGWNDFGYNSLDMPNASPNIVHLSETGVRLHMNFAQPSCTPSRAALMTGRYPISTGMQHECIQADSAWGLPLDETLMPELLKDAGYHTSMLGKWDLGHFTKQMWPTSRGFDTYLGLTNRGLSNYFTHVNSGWIDIHRGTEPETEVNGTYATQLWRDEGLKILREHAAERASEPLFLYVAFNAIHDTLSVPSTFKSTALYANLTKDITYSKRKLAAGAMYLADEAIGAFMEEMQSSGMYEHSVLVCVSDNGASVADGGNNWPLRGAKKDYYQGGIRVPGFVHSPMLTAAGRAGSTYTHLFHLTDWLPTLVTGVAKQSLGDLSTDGYNQWDALMDSSVAGPRTEVLHNIDYLDDSSEYVKEHADVIASITAWVDGGLYKLILNDQGYSDGSWYEAFSSSPVYLDGGIGNETRFIFDLNEDPTELVNLFGHPGFVDVRNTLVARLCEFWGQNLVDTMYNNGVHGWPNSRVKAVYEAANNYITYWEDSNPGMVSEFTVSGWLDAVGIFDADLCPFVEFLVGQN